MPDKLTDSEIVKSFECHLGVNPKRCSECAYTQYGCYCLERLHPDLLDLINRLQAENEKLKKSKYIFANVDYCADDLDKALKENEELKSAINGFRGYEDKSKAEAYKEFAERLKNKINDKFKAVYNQAYHRASIKDIDNLLKELVGENDDR